MAQTTAQTAAGWWVEPPRVDLAEIMDDLEPGWAGWGHSGAPDER